MSNNELSNIISMASIQDSLLQSYRGFQLTTQAIFIAIGAAVTSDILLYSEINRFRFVGLIVLFGALFVMSLIILYKFHQVILSRGKDVDYWHEQILTWEKKLPDNERFFTEFKNHQKSHRNYFKDKLIDGMHGHTRKIIDSSIIIIFRNTWIILLLLCLTKIYFFWPTMVS
ncbi:MAG: hypothetical protein JNK69_09075 [Saprospiraceae bacterium]|nr:hypothetical protein [Saprospiraceae bacterium]